MSPKKILTIAAHPDDELLGPGGTVNKFVQNGSEAQVIIACSNDLLHENNINENTDIKTHAERATKIIGYSKCHFLDYKDQALDTVPMLQITSKIEKILYDYEPDTIFVQFYGDINYDHKVLFNAAIVAFRPLKNYINQVFAFETLSSTEWGIPRTFKADTYVDITENIDIKCLAFNQYLSEIEKSPHPRSIEAIRAHAKSCGSTINCEYAERFQTLWRVYR